MLIIRLTEQRDEQAAKRILTKAIRRHSVPARMTIDGSRSNAAAIASDIAAHRTTIEVRQGRCLSKLVEQDHRSVKRLTHPMLGFKAFEAAQHTVAGIDLMPRLRKQQLAGGVEGSAMQVML